MGSITPLGRSRACERFLLAKMNAAQQQAQAQAFGLCLFQILTCYSINSLLCCTASAALFEVSHSMREAFASCTKAFAFSACIPPAAACAAGQDAFWFGLLLLSFFVPVF